VEAAAVGEGPETGKSAGATTDDALRATRQHLAPGARLYATGVKVVGLCVLVARFPASLPRPDAFIILLILSLGAWRLGREGVFVAPLAIAAVYLTCRRFRVYVGRLEAERRRVEEVSALHAQAILALDLARRSERDLAADKERLAETLGSLGEAVITSDTSGRLVLLNRLAETLTGWSQDQAVGVPVAAVFRLIDRETGEPRESLVDRVLRLQGGLERDERSALLAKDGTRRLVEHSGTPIRDNDGRLDGVVLVIRDVTDAVRLEEERLTASKLASLGVLAGGIAHDFNNILTTIVGHISLARLDSAPAERGPLDEAEKGCGRAKALTQQLLTFSKGGAPVRKTVFLRDVIRNAAGGAVRGSSVTCEFAIDETLWAIDADEGQTTQVITNVVLNSVQATPDGGIIVVRADNIPAGADPRAEAAAIRITIQDHGVGISESHLAKVFDPYFTTKKRGSGLGLATAYSIVRNHGGRLEIRSAIGQGTTVVITLPALPDRGTASRRDETGRAASGRGRILFMDDEEAIRGLAGMMLARLGYSVEAAADGREAVEMYVRARDAGHAFDVVIMDLTVPGGMGGEDTIKALLGIDPNVRAIVSSGYADDPVMAEFARYGFKGVVPKPFTVASLGDELRYVLG
jgi:two-component system cell cycle sensor histidine kinase/response regulator CckA